MSSSPQSSSPGAVAPTLRALLFGVAACLGAVAAAGFLIPELRIVAGPIRISATDPWRVLVQATAAWLVAVLAVPPRRRATVHVVLALAALLLAVVGDSFPRRIGDGAEYVAMAVNLSEGRGPALSPADRSAVTEVMRRAPGFEGTTLDGVIPGKDGKGDFQHFWLYSLIVAPVLRVVAGAGGHFNQAFTLVNLLLLAAFMLVLLDHRPVEVAVVAVAGPALWWIDKAHGEIFLYVALGTAALCLERRPMVALIAAGAAAAQNPAAGVVLPICLAGVLRRRPVMRGARAAIVAGVLIAATAPAYYLWHLGIWSPLSAATAPHWPSLRGFLTPLFDPNLGLVPHAPIIVLFAVVGLFRVSRTALATTGLMIVAVLAACSQTPNVNHGGSPGMSRYALWTLAVALPLVAAGCERVRDGRATLLRLGVAASVVLSLVMFRPALPDRHGLSANRLAGFLWTAWPSLDNPLPEIFAERSYGQDGAAMAPVATGGCEKVLIRGDGRDAWWPVPCEPGTAPEPCVADGALCYQNGDGFTVAPRQPGFRLLELPPYAWTARTAGRYREILSRLGPGARFVKTGESAGRVDPSSRLSLHIVEGPAGAAVWIGERRPGDPLAPLQLRLDAAARMAVRDPVTLAPLEEPLVLPPGRHRLQVPSTGPRLVVILDRP